MRENKEQQLIFRSMIIKGMIITSHICVNMKKNVILMYKYGKFVCYSILPFIYTVVTHTHTQDRLDLFIIIYDA